MVKIRLIFSHAKKQNIIAIKSYNPFLQNSGRRPKQNCHNNFSLKKDGIKTFFLFVCAMHCKTVQKCLSTDTVEVCKNT